eukprot:4623535-Amphidinium_carterae.1
MQEARYQSSRLERVQHAHGSKQCAYSARGTLLGNPLWGICRNLSHALVYTRRSSRAVGLACHFPVWGMKQHDHQGLIPQMQHCKEGMAVLPVASACLGHHARSTRGVLSASIPTSQAHHTMT